MAKIMDIEGIGEKYAQKLGGAGIRTTQRLLAQCASAKGRKDVAGKTGISEDTLLEWANYADLYRIKGIGSEYSHLLETAGVDSVPELAQRNAEHLAHKLAAVNQEKEIVRRVPGLKQVTDWIEQAKRLPKVVTH